MKKILIGNFLLALNVFEPVIGYLILKDLNIPDSVQTITCVAWVFTGILQFIFIGGLIHTGFKEIKVSNPFNDL